MRGRTGRLMTSTVSPLREEGCQRAERKSPVMSHPRRRAFSHEKERWRCVWGGVRLNLQSIKSQILLETLPRWEPTTNRTVPAQHPASRGRFCHSQLNVESCTTAACGGASLLSRYRLASWITDARVWDHQDMNLQFDTTAPRLMLQWRRGSEVMSYTPARILPLS